MKIICIQLNCVRKKVKYQKTPSQKMEIWICIESKSAASSYEINLGGLICCYNQSINQSKVIPLFFFIDRLKFHTEFLTSEQVPWFRMSVDLGVMIINKYLIFIRCPEHEPLHQMLFHIIISNPFLVLIITPAQVIQSPKSKPTDRLINNNMEFIIIFIF